MARKKKNDGCVTRLNNMVLFLNYVMDKTKHLVDTIIVLFMYIIIYNWICT